MSARASRDLAALAEREARSLSGNEPERYRRARFDVIAELLFWLFIVLAIALPAAAIWKATA
jgi:hypothetical protein